VENVKLQEARPEQAKAVERLKKLYVARHSGQNEQVEVVWQEWDDT